MSESYEATLQTAIDAAREAGALLRQEFLRPGGPAGKGDHAPVDEPAEQLIRERLLAATPAWSYRGEETGYREGDEGHHLWLVDPNDGTSAYLQGWRGTATSIALLRDGVPVLGVVYAYAAPDNEGDLFAWGEGCGPLRRNGGPVERRAWAPLSPETVALLGQAADRAPSEYLACVAPGRYRAETTIAYRLALVAAGEGEVAVEPSGLVGWDYAGGHALLLGRGGMLMDGHSRPVSYSREGQSDTRRCFGGEPGLLAELAPRPWDLAVEAAGIAAALATIEVLERPGSYDHLFGLGGRMRQGLREIVQRQGVEATVAGFGSIFLTYFMAPPIDSFTDLLRNDAGKFVAYRRAMIDRGFYMLPVNLKRNHISLAHSEEDIDRTLEVVDEVLRSL